MADFYEGLRPIAAEWLGCSVNELTRDVSYGLTEWGLDVMGGYDTLHRFAITQRNLFKVLQPIHGAPAALRRLSAAHVRIRIITHRLFVKHFHQEAIRQTIAWLDHYGIRYWDLCFMQEKAAVGADLYIEDSPENVIRLREQGCKTIVFTNSTNGSISDPRADDWEVVEKLVLQERKQWERE